MPRSKNEIGILLSIGGYSAWVAGDSFAKLASSLFSIPQIMAISFLATMFFVLGLAAMDGGYRQLSSKRPWYQLLSSVLAAASGIGAVAGVIYLSLADFYTIVFSAPLVATILAWLVLKEKIGAKIWLATAFGFAGILVAVRFSGHNEPPLSWIGIGFTCLSSLTYCFASLVVRAAPGENNYALSFWPRVFGFVASVIFLLCQGEALTWNWLGLLYCTLAGILAGLGVVLTNLSLRYAPVGVVTPYHYTQIIGGALIGYLVWHNVPSLSVVIGAMMVTGSGLFILRQQRETARQFATEPT